MTKAITKEEAVKLSEENQKMQTACWDCIFSCSQEDGVENLGNYCSTNRLEKLKNAGAEIIDVMSEQKGKKFKIVSDRICNMFRTKIWEENQQRDDDEAPDFAEIARKEVQIRCNALIYISDIQTPESQSDSRKDTKKRLNKIASTMQSLCDSDIAPSHITLINNTKITPYDFINFLRIEIREHNYNVSCEWHMEYIDPKHEEISDKDKSEVYEKCLDIAAKDPKACQYFAVFFEGNEISKNYLSKIDEAINDKMKRFLVLLPEEPGDGGLFIQQMAYKQFAGNKGGKFIDKITEVADEQKCQKFILPLSEIL